MKALLLPVVEVVMQVRHLQRAPLIQARLVAVAI